MNYDLIASDNKTPFQRALIFLVFLQHDCPEITSEMLIKALKKISLHDTADVIERKMQESALPVRRVNPQLTQQVSTSFLSP